MSTSIYRVPDQLRDMATSEHDKGSMLERLLLQYLRNDPVWAEQFDDVRLWSDWPGRASRPDTGIDLVATDALNGGLVAIQSKFYAPRLYRLEAGCRHLPVRLGRGPLLSPHHRVDDREVEPQRSGGPASA